MKTNEGLTSSPLHDSDKKSSTYTDNPSASLTRPTSTTSSGRATNVRQPSSAYLASKGLMSPVKKVSSDSPDVSFALKLHLEALQQHGTVRRRYMVASAILLGFGLLIAIFGIVLLSLGRNDTAILFVIAALSVGAGLITSYNFAGYYYNW